MEAGTDPAGRGWRNAGNDVIKNGSIQGRGCPKSRIAPFAIVYFGKKNYLTVAKKQTL